MGELSSESVLTRDEQKSRETAEPVKVDMVACTDGGTRAPKVIQRDPNGPTPARRRVLERCVRKQLTNFELFIAPILLLAIALPVQGEQSPEDHSKDLDRCASAWIEVAKNTGSSHSFKDLLNLATFRELYEKLPESDRETCIRVGKERLSDIAAAVRGRPAKSLEPSTKEEARPQEDAPKQ